MARSSSGMLETAESKCTIERRRGYFINPFPEFNFVSPVGALRLLLWQKDDSNVPSEEAAIDEQLPYHNNFKEVNASSSNSVTWIGHASCLLKMSGLFVLTDPIFSQHCSAVQWNLSKKLSRFRQPGLVLDDIPHVDAIVISHNHYDHLDYSSVMDIKKKFAFAQWFVPLGLKQWFVSSGVPSDYVHEMNWWEEKSHTFPKGKGLTFTCLPAQHWTLRSGFDRNYTLWCGWSIKSDEKNVYFAGDTGYNDRIFKQIGNHCGAFDLSLIPIGAYKPRDIMKCQHVDPTEAVKVHSDVRSKFSLGIHWGTFALAYEHYLDPPKDLKNALEEASLDEQSFVTFKHGESREF